MVPTERRAAASGDLPETSGGAVVVTEPEVTPDPNVRPPIPVSGIIYGEFVYWITILGSVIAIVGATIAMFGVPNYLDPSYVFSAIWEGKTTTEIWEGAVGANPQGHWYLSRLGHGDALAMFGLALGVFSVIPGMIGAMIAMYRKREVLFGTFTLIAVVLCITSLVGLIQISAE